ncbi:MAG: porin family protein [Crocinitomicaceae bacterium]|nr:porin family protein [Crocinitomicaceae bacterium]
MKKAIAFVVALSATATSFAQHEVGVKAGYNHLMTNYLTGDTDVETDGGGYHVGAYYSYSPMDNVFIGGEVLISSRRWNAFSSSTTDGSILIKDEQYSFYSNHYLDIPLSIKYGINMRKGRYGDSKYLLFYAGPTASLLMSTSGSTQTTTRIDAHSQTTVTQEEVVFQKQDLKTHFRPFQLGYNVGVSYRFGFGLTIDARYQGFAMPTIKTELGLGPADLVPIEELDREIKQGMFMISIGYSFVRD